MNRLFISLMLCVVCVMTSAQTDRDYVRRGNRYVRDTAYAKAQVEYQKAIEKDNTNATAYYNLGNAFLYQSKAEDAMKEYETATKLERNKLRLAKFYHNMGVMLQSAKQFDQAIGCYKNSLRNNPECDETRYNYALCLYQMKKNGSDENQEGENKEEDQNSDEKQQDQEQQEQQKKENEQQQQQEQQPDPNQMSKENAEQMLKAAMQDEKDTQEKLQKMQQQRPQKHLLKQW